MAEQTIPVTNNPNQLFDFDLKVNNITLPVVFSFVYNRIAGYWYMTLTNRDTLEILLDSVPLLTSDNLLEQYAYLNIGSAYIRNVGNVSFDSPDDTNLGIDFLLIWDDDR